MAKIKNIFEIIKKSCNLSAIPDTNGKPPKLREMEMHIGHNFFQDIANEIDEKFCPKSLDKMSVNLLQNA
ncbi:MAG: hypothetical protein II852_05585 [Bacteroidales bacterium]|nr:hypothetical protein [Bacteroidales bacterium]